MLEIKRSNINNHTKFIEMIENEVLPFYFEGYTNDSLYAHLQYTGCTTILSEGSTYKRPAELYITHYIGLFNKGFTKEEFDSFMGFDTKEIQQIITTCQQDSHKYQLDAMTPDTLAYNINKYHFEEYKDKLNQFYNQTSMSEQEIIENISLQFPNFKTLDTLWNSTRTFKAMSLTSVGLAIAILNYNMKTGEDILLKDYLSL
jgi:hypothetical protein